MTIARRAPGQPYDVYVYDRVTKRKRYVGRAAKLDDARVMEVKAKAERRPAKASEWSVDDFAAKFLAEHHGPNTRRPGPATLKVNDNNLRAFRVEYGPRKLGSVTREQATAWAKAHPGQAKTLGAMYALAVDLEYLVVNPFARLGIGRGRGRADIDPLTEAEVEKLAEIALRSLGKYGPEFWAFILWQGWTGMRPGETCALPVSAIDWDARTVLVARNARNDGSYGPVKGNVRRTVPLADKAIEAAQSLHRGRGQLFRSPTRLPLRPNSIRHYWAQVRTGFTAELSDSHWLRRRLMVGATVFAEHDFGEISSDHVVSMAQFADRARRTHAYADRTLLRLDPFVVHAAPDIAPPGGERAFVKISLSHSRYNLRGNSHNHAFDYAWRMWARDEIRNDPAYAGGDAGPQELVATSPSSQGKQA
jgi:integrase